MSPYERQIDPLEAVDIHYVVGIPGQAAPIAEESLEVRYPPPSAQRFEPAVPSLAAGLDPRIGVGIGGAALALCLIPVANVVAALLAVAALVLGVRALRRTADLPADAVRLALATVGLAVVAGTGSAVSLVAHADADGPSPAQIARANGTATAQVLAHDLGAGLGAYRAGGLPVTLTNIANAPLAYNVTVEALDGAGRRVTADVAFVGTLAADESTVVTMFSNASGGTAAELAGATFRIVEASSF